MNGETSDEDSCGGASENTSLMSTQVEPGTTDPDVGSSLQTTDQVIESNQIFQIVKKPMYPVRWTAQSALHFTPWQTCLFRHQLDFSGKHSTSHAAKFTCKDYSLIFPPPSITRYSFSFIQLSELRCRGKNENSQTSKW